MKVVRDLETGATKFLGGAGGNHGGSHGYGRNGEHSAFRGGSPGGVRGGYISKRAPPRHTPAVPESKITISNLHHEVNNNDIYELFCSIGPIVRALVVYDRDGNHSGRGEVTYECMDHAIEAIKRYNGVPLDNRPLEISLSDDSSIPMGRAPGTNRRNTAGHDYDNDGYDRRGSRERIRGRYDDN